jgi:hypothetical protein
MSRFLQSDHVGTDSVKFLVKLLFFTGRVSSNLKYCFFFLIQVGCVWCVKVEKYLKFACLLVFV